MELADVLTLELPPKMDAFPLIQIAAINNGRCH